MWNLVKKIFPQNYLNNISSLHIFSTVASESQTTADVIEVDNTKSKFVLGFAIDFAYFILFDAQKYFTTTLIQELAHVIVGGLTVEMVKQFKFDYSILGCSAIDADGDLLDFDGQEVMVSVTAIKRSRKVMVVADNDKFERKAPLTICSLSDVTMLFTDSRLSKELIANCNSWGTEVVIL